MILFCENLNELFFMVEFFLEYSRYSSDCAQILLSNFAFKPDPFDIKQIIENFKLKVMFLKNI